ncbi:4Fe-4S binding protein [bacterium]|nr:4Fe-4S binding protein [bacterium]
MKKIVLALSIAIFGVALAVGQGLLPRFKVDSKRCIGCAQCVPKCPVGAITMERGRAVIDPEKCIGCGICVDVCPVIAISQMEIEKPSETSSQQGHAASQSSETSSQGNRHRRGQQTASRIETEKTVDSPKAEPTAEKVSVPILDASRCISCGICAKICPVDAIEMVDGRPVIDPEKCTGCGLCIEKCPFNALSFPEKD